MSIPPQGMGATRKGVQSAMQKALGEKLVQELAGIAWNETHPTALEPTILTAYKDELLLAIWASEPLGGIWSSKNGVTWKRIWAKEASLWCYQLFNGKLYFGGSYDGLAKILQYDGTEFKEVFSQPDGVGGGGGAVEALGVFTVAGTDYLYAGRRNEIWRSPDGETWERVFTFTTNKGIYQFLLYAGYLYAFEGEPVGAPCKIYRASEVDGVWEEFYSATDVSWFRSHSPSDRQHPLPPLVGDGRGYVWRCDPYPDKFMAVRRGSEGEWEAVAIRCKTIGNQYMIIVGCGTGALPSGKMFSWDGERLLLLADLPLAIADAELFRGQLYLLCNSRVQSSYADYYGANQALVLKFPTFPFPLPFSMTIPLWEDKSIGTGGDAVGEIPCLGLEATFYILSDQSGTAYIQACRERTGLDSYVFDDIDSFSVAANTVTPYTITTLNARLVRLRFVPTATAIVSAWVSLNSR